MTAAELDARMAPALEVKTKIARWWDWAYGGWNTNAARQ